MGAINWRRRLQKNGDVLTATLSDSDSLVEAQPVATLSQKTSRKHSSLESSNEKQHCPHSASDPGCLLHPVLTVVHDGLDVQGAFRFGQVNISAAAARGHLYAPAMRALWGPATRRFPGPYRTRTVNTWFFYIPHYYVKTRAYFGRTIENKSLWASKMNLWTLRDMKLDRIRLRQDHCCRFFHSVALVRRALAESESKSGELLKMANRVWRIPSKVIETFPPQWMAPIAEFEFGWTGLFGLAFFLAYSESAWAHKHCEIH
ncbi:hypothetical protein FB451DRAFT_1179184 [Mycena latifolia]|nr:hypothetical protein FB451DRAFT_1179184 [Mycena latifolia]